VYYYGRVLSNRCSKTQIWGFFGFWEIGGFSGGILKVSYNKAFSVKYSKNMRISASQNMFRPIFQVIYHKIYTEFAAFWEHFMYFWGILGDF
jgi:hypothetical protein